MEKKTLKIALVITRMDRGGSSDIVRGLFDHLSSRGHDVTLFTGPTAEPSKETYLFLRENKKKIETIISLQRNPHIVNDLLSLFALHKAFRKGKFDIVHTHTAKAGFVGRIAARISGAGTVIHTAHGHNFYGYFNRAAGAMIVVLEAIAAYFCDRIIALTSLEKKDMLERHICPTEKIVVIPGGIGLAGYSGPIGDAERMKRDLGIGSPGPIAGMVSRLEEVKGPEVFIESLKFTALEVPNASFLIVGDGSLMGRLRERSEELGLEGRIIFTGWREDVHGLMGLMDVVVLPSLNEAVGRSALEAGASGRAVVASKVGGLPEVVIEGVTGILVPPGDPRALADAVTLLLRNGDMRDRMACAAKEWVFDNFNERRMFERTEALYMKELDR